MRAVRHGRQTDEDKFCNVCGTPLAQAAPPPAAGARPGPAGPTARPPMQRPPKAILLRRDTRRRRPRARPATEAPPQAAAPRCQMGLRDRAGGEPTAPRGTPSRSTRCSFRRPLRAAHAPHAPHAAHAAHAAAPGSGAGRLRRSSSAGLRRAPQGYPPPQQQPPPQAYAPQPGGPQGYTSPPGAYAPVPSPGFGGAAGVARLRRLRTPRLRRPRSQARLPPRPTLADGRDVAAAVRGRRLEAGDPGPARLPRRVRHQRERGLLGPDRRTARARPPRPAR